LREKVRHAVYYTWTNGYQHEEESQGISGPYVRLKRSTEGMVGDGSTSAQALFGKESLCRGSPAKELAPTAMPSLGVGIGG
jgi:hypothetical protein